VSGLLLRMAMFRAVRVPIEHNLAFRGSRSDEYAPAACHWQPAPWANPNAAGIVRPKPPDAASLFKNRFSSKKVGNSMAQVIHKYFGFDALRQQHVWV